MECEPAERLEIARLATVPNRLVRSGCPLRQARRVSMASGPSGASNHRGNSGLNQIDRVALVHGVQVSDLPLTKDWMPKATPRSPCHGSHQTASGPQVRRFVRSLPLARPMTTHT